MARPHLAAVVEDGYNRALGAVLRGAGWQHAVVPLAGYGSADFLRVLARVTLAPGRGASGAADGSSHASSDGEELARRGWRNFLTAEAPAAEVRVLAGRSTYRVRADRSGIVDVRLPNPGLEPGWREVVVSSEQSQPTPVPVLVVDEDEEFGILSDIDDTVIRTYLPRPLIAAYNAFVLSEASRTPVPGMAFLFAELLAGRPSTPTVYLSTGAWNTARTLTRFLARNGYPSGPMLMTDWGPTHTGWFRSGQEHKRASLRRLAEDFPRIRWVLVGDDGQHDPALYAEFADQHPDRVRVIAIRQLAAGEHVLAHGTPGGLADAAEVSGAAPEVRAPDGRGLVELLRGLDAGLV